MSRYRPPTYLHSQEAVAATTEANNMLLLYNPANSGKLLTPGAVFISYVQTVISPVITGARGFRCGAPTGGTRQDDSTICKFNTTSPDAAGEIYTANPTLALGAAIFNSPPGLDKRASDVHQVDVPPGAGPFILLPGEGLVVRQSAGIVGLHWNLSIVWAEREL